MPPKQAVPPLSRKGAGSLKISGHMFFPEMRTACQLLALNKVEFTEDIVDLFSEAGTKEYALLNPSEQIPTIIDDSQTIIGDSTHVYKYLCKTRNIPNKFYPSGTDMKQQRQQVDSILEWIQWQLKRCTKRIAKFKLTKALIEKGFTTLTPQQKDQLQKEEAAEMELFNEVCLPNLEILLQQARKYICGSELSVADLAYYNELVNVFGTLNAKLDERKFEHIKRWMDSIAKLPEVQKYEQQFYDQVKKMEIEKPK